MSCFLAALWILWSGIHGPYPSPVAVCSSAGSSNAECMITETLQETRLELVQGLLLYGLLTSSQLRQQLYAEL